MRLLMLVFVVAAGFGARRVPPPSIPGPPREVCDIYCPGATETQLAPMSDGGWACVCTCNGPAKIDNSNLLEGRIDTAQEQAGLTFIWDLICPAART